MRTFIWRAFPQLTVLIRSDLHYLLWSNTMNNVLANYEFFHFMGTNPLLPHLHYDTHSSRKFAVLHKVASNGTIKIKELFAGIIAFRVSN